ncbi:MAG: methyltransferase domain-containing protein [Pseudomonadota bacterium]
MTATAALAPSPTSDFAAIKTKQRAALGDGNYAIVGATLQIVGETLAEAADLRAGEAVLDVAAGNGNATLAAARRFCEVTSTDYVPELLEAGHRRAKANGFEIAFQEADVEALPFADNSFDAVTSTFGAMFAPNQPRTAAEMLRVTRPGGRVAMANWTPESFIGALFKLIGQHVPPPAGLSSPALWGREDRLRSLFGAEAEIAVTQRSFTFHYRSPAHWVEVFRRWYGPTKRVFEALPEAGKRALEADLHGLAGEYNTATDGRLAAPSSYAEVIVTKR